MDRTEDFVGLVRLHPGLQEFRGSGTSGEPARQRDELELVADKVGRSVEELVSFAASAQRRYVDFDTDRGMSPKERRAFDQAISRIIKDAVSQLDLLKLEAVRRVDSGRYQAESWTGHTEESASHAAFGAHILGVVAILNERLQAASQTADLMRSARIRHEILDTSDDQETHTPETLSVPFRDWTPFLPRMGSESRSQLTQKDITNDIQDPQLVQAFQEENDALQTELLDTLTQVRQAERTVTEVAALNQLFATKVLEQAHEIEQLYDDAVKTNFFIRRGNRELTQMKQSGNRIVHILSLLVLGLAVLLLFIDFLF